MLLALALAPFVLAFLLPLIAPWAGKRIGWTVLPLPLVIFLAYASHLPITAGGGTVSWSCQWVDYLGLALSFRLNGMALLFAMLVSFIGFLVVLYSIFYLHSYEKLTDFYVFLLLFMGSMLGVATAANLILLYIFWELTSISSFLLIGFWYHKDKAVHGAQRSLLLTVSGGFAMLAGFIIIGVTAGSFDLSVIAQSTGTLKASPLYSICVILVLCGAFAKSAQIPFHIWLPAAMEAPTPISCYLHSATMVKAGIFLLAILTPILGGTPIWCASIALVGMASLFFGSFMALKQTDLKALLAYSTISQLGLIICLIGIGSKAAVFAAVFHLLNHSAFKGSLFLVAGIVDHQTGTRDMRALKGLIKIMPYTALVAFISSFSMAGLPFFSGFLSKEMFLESVVESYSGHLAFLGTFTYLLPIFAVLASILTFVYSLSFFGKVFLGQAPEKGSLPQIPRESGAGMLAPALLLASLNIIFAVFPNVTARWLVAPAAGTILGEQPQIHVAFWHGLTLPFLLTVIIITIGSLLYWRIDDLKKFLTLLKASFGAERFYEWSIPAMLRCSDKVVRGHMTGSLRDYILGTALASVIFIMLPVFSYGLWHDLSLNNFTPIDNIEFTLFFVIAIATMGVTLFNRRLWALICLSVVGYGVSLFFVIMDAPDLALTQVLVESIVLVLYLLAFPKLPKNLRSYNLYNRRKISNIVVSALAGFSAAFLVIFANSNRIFQTISSYYGANSLSKGGGHNIVNVILVDFRGLDTMGEITVLALASVGVFALIRLEYNRRNKVKKGEEQHE